MNRYYDVSAQKKPLNLTINADLAAQARTLTGNLSAKVEALLPEYVTKERDSHSARALALQRAASEWHAFTESRGRGDSRGDVACPERNLRFVPPTAVRAWAPSTGKRPKKAAEPADKPGSVVDSHSSRRHVTAALKQPTRIQRGPRQWIPIWSCSRWGLPCRSVTGLAVRSYRTISPLPAPRKERRRYLSVALSVGLRRPGVTWHLALWSPDFPRHSCE